MTAQPDELRLEIAAPTATIVISNPARMNALTAAMWARVPETVAQAEADPTVRVIVLCGDGERAFSAGADISEFETARAGTAAKDYDALNHAAFEALANCAKPTVAMINGFCLGGGLGLALCCDLRLADPTATFAIPAGRLGIGYNPRWVRQLLTAVSPPRAKEILFSARRIPAAEALAMGLVNHVVPSDQLAREVARLAADIAANAPLTLRAAKHAIDHLTRHPGVADTSDLDALVEACFTSADYAEGRRAFLEKRPPHFQGR